MKIIRFYSEKNRDISAVNNSFNRLEYLSSQFTNISAENLNFQAYVSTDISDRSICLSASISRCHVRDMGGVTPPPSLEGLDVG